MKQQEGYKLIKQWRKDADKCFSQSKRTWEKLRTGELPQDDETIYAVYQYEQQGVTLEACANQLEAILFSEPKGQSHD